MGGPVFHSRAVCNLERAGRSERRNRFGLGLAVATVLAVFSGATTAQAAIDWAGVPGRQVTLFYPGQASWEWALTPANMGGANSFRQEGKACRTCHDGEEQKMGSDIVTGAVRNVIDENKAPKQRPSIEPNPIAGKPGSLTATVKFAQRRHQPLRPSGIQPGQPAQRTAEPELRHPGVGDVQPRQNGGRDARRLLRRLPQRLPPACPTAATSARCTWGPPAPG